MTAVSWAGVTGENALAEGYQAYIHFESSATGLRSLQSAFVSNLLIDDPDKVKIYQAGFQRLLTL